jgi:hypothetical protein
MDNIVSRYTLHQAIEDGILAEVFKNRWEQLSCGKPIVATAHIMDELSVAALQEIWNAYVAWTKQPQSDEVDTFVTQMDGRTVWVIKDGEALTILYPEDY